MRPLFLFESSEFHAGWFAVNMVGSANLIYVTLLCDMNVNTLFDLHIHGERPAFEDRRLSSQDPKCGEMTGTAWPLSLGQ